MERVDIAIVGAGVIGLACARALAMAGREVIVIEKAGQIGTGASSRNSEVIHAGLYYSPGSLKAELCVRGKALLYEYCVRQGIAHQRIGKLLVATHEAQHDKLAAIAANARQFGVDDLLALTARQAQRLEPALHCSEALLSPSTGIINSHAYMLALQADAEQHGASFAFMSEVRGGEADAASARLQVAADGSLIELQANRVINCAGLHGVALAQQLSESSGLHASRAKAHWAKGHYFSLSGRCPFHHLVYPMPEAGGLGVHLTLDLAGQARFGPDVQWLDNSHHEDYGFDQPEARRHQFARAISQYWPSLNEAQLSPAYTGIRSKLAGEGEAAADFQIAQQGALIHCLGIESPGLTASLALAEYVTRLCC